MEQIDLTNLAQNPRKVPFVAVDVERPAIPESSLNEEANEPLWVSQSEVWEVAAVEPSAATVGFECLEEDL